MRLHSAISVAVAAIAIPAAAQSDPALGRAVAVDFTKGPSDSFRAQGSVSYDSNGVSFTVAKSGDNPQLVSGWYFMFGHFEVVLKAAPGVGIVSSAILQSDVKDEIDWEWLGASPDQVQTNYFGKGQTTTYDRGAFHADAASQSSFKTYTIDWTADQVTWQIDGTTVRTLLPATANGQYPQTPMQVKLGAWSGGDAGNQPGTIEWAGGPTDYSRPYSMQVKSVKVTDYSTGKSYSYSGSDSTWKSVNADGGQVGSAGSAGSGKADNAASPAATAVVSTAVGQPIPFATQAGSASKASASTMVSFTSYPGLPSGWTVSSSGKVVPPSSAPLRKHSIPFSPCPPSAGACPSYHIPQPDAISPYR